MGSKSPFFMTDNVTHVLSKYAQRVGKSGQIAEYSIDLNNWNSQFLAHTFGDISDITIDDLSDYAADKNVDINSRVVQNFHGTLLKSRPLAMYLNNGKWRAEDRKPVSIYNQIKWNAIADRLDKLFDRDTDQANQFSNLSTSTKVPQSTSVLNWLAEVWDEEAEGMDYFQFAFGQNTDTDLIRMLYPDYVARINKPFTWLLSIFAEHGMDTDNAYMIRSEQSGIGRNPVEDPERFFLHNKNLVTIVGPMDAVGNRVKFAIPAFIDSDINNMAFGRYIRHFGTGSNVQPANGSYVTGGYVPFTTAMLAVVNERTSHRNLVDYKHLKFFQRADTTPVYNRLAYSNQSTSPRHTDVVINALEGEFVQATNAPHDPFVAESDTWSVCIPSGFIDVAMKEPFLAVNTSANRIKRLNFSPSRVYVRTSMVGVREYLAVLRDDPATTPADKLGYENAIKKSEGEADTIISTTILNTQLKHPSLQEMKDWKFTSKLEEAGEDIFVDPFSDESDETMTTAFKRMEKHAKKNVGYLAFSYQLDEGASENDLVSSYVADRLPASLWTLEMEATGGVPAFVSRGQFFDDQPYPLTDTETAYLLAQGATEGDTFDREVFLSQSVLTNDDLTDLEDIPSSALSIDPEGIRDSVKGSIGWMHITPAKFLDLYGYPRVDFTERDTETRAITAYKGWGDDPTSIVITMVFS